MREIQILTILISMSTTAFAHAAVCGPLQDTGVRECCSRQGPVTECCTFDQTGVARDCREIQNSLPLPQTPATCNPGTNCAPSHHG